MVQKVKVSSIMSKLDRECSLKLFIISGDDLAFLGNFSSLDKLMAFINEFGVFSSYKFGVYYVNPNDMRMSHFFDILRNRFGNGLNHNNTIMNISNRNKHLYDVYGDDVG